MKSENKWRPKIAAEKRDQSKFLFKYWKYSSHKDEIASQKSKSIRRPICNYHKDCGSVIVYLHQTQVKAHDLMIRKYDSHLIFKLSNRYQTVWVIPYVTYGKIFSESIKLISRQDSKSLPLNIRLYNLKIQDRCWLLVGLLLPTFRNPTAWKQRITYLERLTVTVDFVNLANHLRLYLAPLPLIS